MVKISISSPANLVEIILNYNSKELKIFFITREWLKMFCQQLMVGRYYLSTANVWKILLLKQVIVGKFFLLTANG